MPQPNPKLLRYDEREIGAALCPLTRKALRQMASKGIRPTLAETIWLNDRARVVMRPAVRAENAGRPILCGNVWLWPLTWGASSWLLWVIDLSGDESFHVSAMMYAHANARSASAFAHAWDYDAACELVRTHALSVCATPQEIDAALNALNTTSLYSHASNREGEADTPTLSDPQQAIISTLCKGYGGTPDYWAWDISVAECCDYAGLLRDQADAAGKHMDLNSPIMIAQKLFDYAVLSIEAHYG